VKKVIFTTTTTKKLVEKQVI